MQKIRYNNRFSFNATLSEEILNKSILHMSLMPLVENAIFHGFPYKDKRDGIIEISGEFIQDGTGIAIIIKDNGVGIEPQKMLQIMETEDFEDSINDTSRKRNRYVSIGVKNVHDRLKLYYGEAYGLTLKSELGKGTTVTVFVPNINFNQ